MIPSLLSVQRREEHRNKLKLGASQEWMYRCVACGQCEHAGKVTEIDRDLLYHRKDPSRAYIVTCITRFIGGCLNDSACTCLRKCIF